MFTKRVVILEQLLFSTDFYQTVTKGGKPLKGLDKKMLPHTHVMSPLGALEALTGKHS